MIDTGLKELPKIKEVYSDFANNFASHPIRRSLSKLTNEEAVKQSLRNLIFTNRFERPFKPIVGCNVRKMLFENMDPANRLVLQTEITTTIENFEPRVRLVGVNVRHYEDINTVTITLAYFIINMSTSLQTLEFILERVR